MSDLSTAIAEMSELLVGDPTVFAKAAPMVPNPKIPNQTSNRERKITAGLSTVGGAAGAVGLAYSGKKLAGEFKNTPKALGTAARVGRAIKSDKMGATLLPLEMAGLGGEVLSTKILHNDTKKQNVTSGVIKMDPSSSDVHVPSVSTGKLKRIAANKGINATRATVARAKPIVQRKLKVVNTPPAVGNESVSHRTKEGKSNKNPVSKSVTWEGEISKVDTDKRQVFGWASIVEVNGKPVVDLQGDYIDHDELEKSAYDYVIKSRKGGNMHLRNGEEPVHVSDMIESFLVTPEKKEKLGLPDEMPTGWWVGYQINDDEAWNLVKSGKRTAFSIHGRGQRTPMED